MVLDKIYTGVINLVLFFSIIFFRKIVHKEGIKSFLFHFDKKGRKFFWEGFFSGFLFFIIYCIITIITKQGKVHVFYGGIKETLVIILSGLFAYLSVSLLEESFFRGYVLEKLSNVFPTNIAAIISSVFFGLFHIQAYSTSKTIFIGIINAALIGIILSTVVIKTKSIMLPLGYHLSWNLIQSILFNNYKYNVKGLIALEIKENIWTGYSIIPESGLIITSVCIIMLIYFRFRLRDYSN